MVMKRTFVVVLTLIIALAVNAQGPKRKFDPVQFERDLEQYITKEASLSVYESSVFFPLYREMMGKQRVIFGQMKRYRFVDVQDNEASADAIEKQDALDIKMKELQQEYHRKFMKVLPAGKVFQIIKAESRFHRQAFRRAARGR
uniref:Uncharacterized protein n=3 Tax=unclassified Prevotella TaxID=2638335 RepID=A0AB33IXT9_9BACT